MVCSASVDPRNSYGHHRAWEKGGKLCTVAANRAQEGILSEEVFFPLREFLCQRFLLFGSFSPPKVSFLWEFSRVLSLVGTFHPPLFSFFF